jgi:peptidoglycan/LPS O-acetylase OafA/YrhL
MYSTYSYRGRPDWIAVYALKRFFRIAPLFYVMLAANIALALLAYGHSPPLSTVILNVSFLFNFFPDQQTSVVWAGWTIGVEMIFYALLPLLIGLITSINRAVFFTAVAALISGSAVLQLGASPLFPLSAQMSFPTQIQFFAGGIMVYFLYLRFKNPSSSLAVPICAAVIASALFIAYTDSTGNPAVQYGAALLFCAALCLWQAVSPSRVFSNRFVVFWGERSFSMYLLHGPILLYCGPMFIRIVAHTGNVIGFPLCTALSLSLVLAASWVTYRLIEAPGILLGKTLYGPVSSPWRLPEVKDDVAPTAVNA